jgi:ribosome-binding factor A
MSVDRIERVNSLLKRVIAESMHQVMQGSALSAGFVTVTSVSCGSDLRDATVFVSVFSDNSGKRKAIDFLNRNARKFQTIINKEVRIKFTPRLLFKLDMGLERGDEVLAILNKIENQSKTQEV